MNETIRCCLRVLAPVHIGCDEVYEPTGFVIDRERGALKSFDALDFLRGLGEEDKLKFSAICRKGTLESILELYGFMRRRFPLGIKTKDVSICDELSSHFAKNLELGRRSQNLKKEFSSFFIPRTTFCTNSSLPFIPGSSVKGALRTAYLNALRGKSGSKRYVNAREMENELLHYQNFQTDPFRLVKVSDFMPFPSVRTKILYAVNRKKKPNQHFSPRGVPQILEVIEPGALFEGWITVASPEKGAGITEPITAENLLQSVESFFSRELDRESTDLRALGIPIPCRSRLPDSRLLRIGRHSGAECVTVEGHRRIRIMTGRNRPGKTESGATTLWFAAESRTADYEHLVPFGWSGLAPLDDQAYNEFIRQTGSDGSEGIPATPILPKSVKPPAKVLSPPIKRPTRPLRDSAGGDLTARNLRLMIEKLIPSDKIGLERILSALDGLNEEEAAELAGLLRERLKSLGQWEKHPKRFDVECFVVGD